MAVFLLFRFHHFSLISPIRPSRNGLPPDSGTVAEHPEALYRCKDFSGLLIFSSQVLTSKWSCWTLLDLLHSLGCIVGNPATRNSLYPGPICTAEAIILQLGSSGSACWAFVIACYTFVLIAGRPKWKAWATENSNSGKARWILCIGVWSCRLFLATIVPIIIRSASPEKGPFCMRHSCAFDLL